MVHGVYAGVQQARGCSVRGGGHPQCLSRYSRRIIYTHVCLRRSEVKKINGLYPLDQEVLPAVAHQNKQLQ